MSFVVSHVRDDGSTAFRDQVTARIEAGHLEVSGIAGGPSGGPFHWAMHKDPRGPAGVGNAISSVLPQPSAPTRNAAAYGAPRPALPADFKARGPGRGGGGLISLVTPPYQAPRQWQQITPEKLIGVWFYAVGEGKQRFTIRRAGDRLLGMVCGPCDNPYTMAALDSFEIHGDTLTFHINHQDWGGPSLPFQNVLTAHLARNELRVVSAIASNIPVERQPFAYLAFSLIGPVPVAATSIH